MFSPQTNFDALICFIYFFRDCRYEKMQQKLLGNWKFSLRNLEVSYHVIEKYMSQFFIRNMSIDLGGDNDYNVRRVSLIQSLN